MPSVFVLQHEYEWRGHDKVKLIGVYASEALAQETIARLRSAPGFRDWPDGFTIDSYEVGVDHWVEGFSTLVPILVPSKRAAGGFEVNHAVWRPGDLYELGELEDPAFCLFAQGDVVRAEERAIPGHGECVLVATERVQGGT